MQIKTHKKKHLTFYYLLIVALVFSLMLLVSSCASSDSDDDDDDSASTSCTGTSTVEVDTSSTAFGAPPSMSVSTTYTYDDSTKLLHAVGSNPMVGPFATKFTVSTLSATQLVLTDEDSSTDYTYTRSSGSQQTADDITGYWEDSSGNVLLLLYFENKAVFFSAMHGVTYKASNGTYTSTDTSVTLTQSATDFSASATRDDAGEYNASRSVSGTTETLTLTMSDNTEYSFTREDQYEPGCGIVGTWQYDTTDMNDAWYFEFFADGNYRIYSTNDQ